MPQSVILIAPNTWTIDLMASLFDAQAARVSRPEDFDEFQIQDLGAESYVICSRFRGSTDEEIADDYRTNDDLEEEFRQDLEGKSYFIITFRGIDFAREAIRTLVSVAPKDTWIDTDYGWVIRGIASLRNCIGTLLGIGGTQSD